MTPAELLLDPRRFLKFDQISNFRDVGGYRTPDGQQVAWRKLLRAGHCDAASAQDAARLEALGITMRFDLRNGSERSPALNPQANCQIACLADQRSATDHETVTVMEQALCGQRPFPGEDFWTAAYRRLVISGQPMFAQFVTSLARIDGPALVHCASGKDRTGLAVAFVLDLLGIDRATIRFDFLLTNLLQAPARVSSLDNRLRSLGKTPDDVLASFAVSTASLDAAFDLIELNYGGTGNYLAEAGMPPMTVAILRDRLLT